MALIEEHAVSLTALMQPTRAVGPWGEQWESLEEFGFPGFLRTDVEGEILTPPALRCLLDSACLMARKLEPEIPAHAKKFGFHVNIGLYIEEGIKKISWIRLRLDPVTFALNMGLDAAEKSRQESFLSKLKALYLIGFAECEAISFRDYLPRDDTELDSIAEKSSKQFDNLIRQKKEELSRRVRSTKKEDVEKIGVWGRLPKSFDESTIQHTVSNWKCVALPDRQLRPHINIRFSQNMTPVVNKSRRGWEALEDADEKDLLCEEFIACWNDELKNSPFVQVEIQGQSWASNGPPSLHMRVPFEEYAEWLSEVCKIKLDIWSGGGWTVEESKKFMELDGSQYARDDIGLLLEALGIQRYQPQQQGQKTHSRSNSTSAHKRSNSKGHAAHNKEVQDSAK
ncbi:hypothetical protein HK098_000378 [Nowakowskiella sp. JEL0407]|nr:hypothetical protein HK098_000378 [Nowakowskiella sp. JEL0407]